MTTGGRIAQLLRSRARLAVLLVGALFIWGGPLNYVSDLASYPWALVRPSLMTEWRGTLPAGTDLTGPQVG